MVEEDDVGSSADDESDAGSETHEDESLTPDTEASPEPAAKMDVEMESKRESESEQMEDTLRDEQQRQEEPPTSTTTNPSPPPPGGFLAARPRRLPRRLALTRAGDELAFDDESNSFHSERESWLCRKKPARFRLASSSSISAGTTPANGQGKEKEQEEEEEREEAGSRKKTRVARASLVYMRFVGKEKKRLAGGAGMAREWGEGIDTGDDSDDELSIL
ncbi:hypothetical protein VTK26DRAFT_6084 [Humicola hyalothermophila]